MFRNAVQFFAFNLFFFGSLFCKRSRRIILTNKERNKLLTNLPDAILVQRKLCNVMHYFSWHKPILSIDIVRTVHYYYSRLNVREQTARYFVNLPWKIGTHFCARISIGTNFTEIRRIMYRGWKFIKQSGKNARTYISILNQRFCSLHSYETH